MTTERVAVRRGLYCLHAGKEDNASFARFTPVKFRTETTTRDLHHDLHRSRIDMDLRKSFSKPFKRLKDKLRGESRKRDGRSGSEDSRSGRGSDGVERSGGSQRNSHLHSEVDVGGAVDSGPSREESNVDGENPALVDANPLAATSSIPHIGEPGSM